MQNKKIFFSSDIHFYHQNIIEYCNRPFNTIEEMNETIIKNWNNAVNSEDTVYFLGDFSLALRPVEVFSQRLQGIKKLIPGNHDWCHSYHKKSRKPGAKEQLIQKYEENGWIVLPEQNTIDLPGLGLVNLSHLPYSDGSGKDGPVSDKFTKYRMVDDGKLLLCGHVHQHFKTKRSPKGTLQINVGVDVWDNFAPVSLDTLIDLVEGRIQVPEALQGKRLPSAPSEDY